MLPRHQPGCSRPRCETGMQTCQLAGILCGFSPRWERHMAPDNAHFVVTVVPWARALAMLSELSEKLVNGLYADGHTATPAARCEHPATTVPMPLWRDPDLTLLRRCLPPAWNPNVLRAIPRPVARDPCIPGSR